MLVIDNPEAPPGEWTRRLIELPLEVEWGQAALFEPGSDGSPGYVYVFGEGEAPAGRKDLMLARATAKEFEDFANWEFMSGDGSWSKSPELVAAIAPNVATELSVDRIEDENGELHYLMVHSEPPLGDRIFVRVARRPEGPWSEPQAVFCVPELKRSQNYFTYAAKGHARLSPPGRLLVSYIVNSNEFSELLSDASIYRPRFITIKLEDLDPPIRPADAY